MKPKCYQHPIIFAKNGDRHVRRCCNHYCLRGDLLAEWDSLRIARTLKGLKEHLLRVILEKWAISGC